MKVCKFWFSVMGIFLSLQFIISIAIRDYIMFWFAGVTCMFYFATWFNVAIDDANILEDKTNG